MPVTVSELLKFLHKFPGTTDIAMQIGDSHSSLVLELADEGGPVLIGAEPESEEETESATDRESIIAQCDRILGLCDEIPEQGSDFSESVSEKVESIKAWAEDGKPVTDKQRDALENMERGARNWVDRSDGRW